MKLKNNLKKHYHYMMTFNLSMHTHIYIQRDGTPAAKMKDNVPLEVKKNVCKGLIRRLEYILNKQMSQYEGKIVTVLCEGSRKR